MNTEEKKVELEVEDTTPLKPIFKWAGGKKDELKFFKHHFPENYDTYLEPFSGGLAVYFHLRPKKAVVCDLHEGLLDLYTMVKEKRMDEIHECMSKNPNEEEHYYKVRTDRNNNEIIKTPLMNACNFFYFRKTAYRGMLRYNKKGGYNVPYGRYKTYNFDIVLEGRYSNFVIDHFVGSANVKL